MRRVAMIGLDAAELSFVRASPDALPNLRRVLGQGRGHVLRSPADLLPGAVWPTFYTGAPPGAHGIYHHLQWDPGSMRLRRVATNWLGCEPFWHALARRACRVIAVDVPMTFPPRPPGGIEVVSWGAHDQLTTFACHPPELVAEIRHRFGRHPMGPEIPVGKSAAALGGIRDDLVEGARRKGTLVRWLVERAPWDLCLAVFGETHRAGHLLWPADGVPDGSLLDVYRAVDGALGEVLASPALAGATVIVFSLHGMGPNTSQEHFVPAVMDRVNARFRDAPAPAGARTSRGLVRRLREVVPARIQDRVARLVPVPLRDAVVNRSLVAGHDWPRTPGLDLLADLNGYIRLNVRGRERDGMLEPDGDQLARYVAWVHECFASLRIAGSDEPLVGGVHPMSETFAGPRAAHLPDLVVTWTGHPPASRVDSPLLGPLAAELATGRSGNHRRDGFCVVSPPDAAPGEPPADIRDLGRLAAGALG